MRMLRGYMKDEHKKNIIFIFAVAVFFIIFSANIYNSIQSYKYRGLCSEYREQLTSAETTNRELAKTIGRITDITGLLHDTAERTVTDARSIIETVEILRSQIKELEDCCGSFNQSEYYQYWDSYYGIE